MSVSLKKSLQALRGHRGSSASPTSNGGAAALIHPTLTLFPLGMDGAGRIWARDANNGNISQSDDWGENWTNLRGLPTNAEQATMAKIVLFDGYVYLAARRSTDSKYCIWRAPNVVRTESLVWEASPVYVLDNTTHNFTTRSVVNAGSQYIFAGTYVTSSTTSDFTSYIARSADGVTWEEAHPDVADVKHVHGVAEDPYNTGHVYATFGDGTSPFYVRRSTDHGATWETLATSQAWQAVQISFSERWVWLAGDRLGSTVFVLDRETGDIYDASDDYHANIAVPGAAASTDTYYRIAYWGAVDPDTDVYYCTANDTSTAGNTHGIFRVSRPGASVALIDRDADFATEVFIGNGFAWVGKNKYPLANFVPL